MKDARKLLVALLALVAAAALAACGGDSTTTDTTGEESAPITGRLAPVAGAPARDLEVDGEVELTRSNGGTTVSLSVTGLKPKTDYIAHLHTGGCNQADPGGPHFQFEKSGSEEPPNEIHLEFTSNAAGEAEAEASSKREVPVGEAGAVVIHTAEEGSGHSHSDKIACAELEGAAAAGGEATAGGGDVPTIEVRDGEPVGGVQTLEYSAGDEIRFRVSSDAAEEVHVHGYDIAKEVPAGGTIELDFPADLEGIYEVELEGLGVQVAELRVNP